MKGNNRAKYRMRLAVVLSSGALLVWPSAAYAMHISEGILPARWCVLWFAVSLPFVWLGLKQIKHRSRSRPEYKPFIALIGAAVFLISCMPIPVPFAGTCSHPCGTGLAAILIGPGPAVVVASVALTFQALFLAHGGLTTLGANIFSMGVAGSFVGYGAFWLARRLGANILVAAFLAGLLSDWATYAGTAFILAGALHGAASFMSLVKVIVLAFIPTQVPLAVLEGILSAGAYRFVLVRRPQLLRTQPMGGAA